ncbi:PilZ domain-containing protein [Halodesulfovibrio sp.]|uniref:PilZ domain-containing protein n=1 Tax=Halodesulfovibrio sp. TaxID=1912772 RepID=UPI0025BBF379|nr:PilZ domain-containing protein [Halodesulfovibrio sp.]
MNSINMHVGESLNIQLASTGQRCWGEVVGFKKDKYLLVETGKSLNSPTFLPEDSVTVRCISNGDGVLCGFRTTVARYLTEPFSQVILHYPREIEQMQLRNESRYNCFCPVTVHFEEKMHEGMLINISEHGGKVLLAALPENGDTEAEEYPFYEDQNISLNIRPFGSASSVVVDAVIKRIIMREGGMTLGLFIDEVVDEQNVFSEFIERCKKFSDVE